MTSRRTPRIAVIGAGRHLRGSHDLTGPSLVREATEAYADSEDPVGRFLAEYQPGVPSGLYAGYRHWCGQEGTPPVLPRAFAARAREAAAGAGRESLSLRTPAPDPSRSGHDRDRGGER